MSDSTLPPTGFSDTDTMNYVVRMVIPMRREFGRSLDVPHFMHDFAYAREVIEQAKISQNERLREYAHLIDTRMFGPRYSGAAAPIAAPAAQTQTPSTDSLGVSAAAAAESQLSEQEMRLRMMAKYKSGLR